MCLSRHEFCIGQFWFRVIDLRDMNLLKAFEENFMNILICCDHIERLINRQIDILVSRNISRLQAELHVNPI